MITHAEYHAARPLPSGPIFAPFAVPADFKPTRCIRRHKLIDDDYEPPQKGVPELSEAQARRSATQKANFKRMREARFSRVMVGNGRMPAKAIAVALHTTRDNIGQSLALLVNDGAVQRTGTGTSTRYEWVRK